MKIGDQSTTAAHLSGFTLVELIVVITILAILGTIWFISIQGYSTWARDASRTSDMVNLAKSMDAAVSAGKSLPLPDANLITVSASGSTIGYQGCAGARVLAQLGVGGKMIDPLSGACYTYATNAALTQYQILAFTEKAPLTLENSMSTAYASTYAAMYPTTRGSQLGILVGTGSNMNQPIQEYASFTGIDLSKTTTGSGYVMVFANSDTTASYSGSLFTFASIRRPDLLANKSLATMDTSLIGYWDMENLCTGGICGAGNDGKLRDYSSNNNPLSTFSTVTSDGKIGASSSFNGNSSYTDATNPAYSAVSRTSNYSFSAWVRINALGGRMQIFENGTNCSDRNGMIFNSSNQNVEFGYYNGSVWISVRGKIKVGEWTHVVGTSSSGSLSLYINGKQQSLPYSDMYANCSNRFMLGKNGLVAGPDYLNGSLDEVRIHNRVLTDAEVQALYSVMR